MEAFIYVIKKYPKVQIKRNDMLDRYKSLPYIYRCRIGHDTVIQIVILEELINKLGTIITDLDIENKKENQ